MGLETAHPDALDRLNKRMTLDDFAGAADALKMRGVALRVFLLIHPPFIPADQQDDWLVRSVDVAFSSGATAVSLIPTRPGNGALEALSASGEFRAPSLEEIERSAQLAHAASPRGRVFALEMSMVAPTEDLLPEGEARRFLLDHEATMTAMSASLQCGKGPA
jgi:uncharacterized Fe-S cluster-containing MiaB family protein